MELKKFSYRTESLLNIITNKLIKEGKWIEGRPWVSITQKHLSKILKCTERCALNHIKKLIEAGILLKEQFNVQDCDRSNFYSIDLSVVDNSNLMVFFSRSILKKIHDIYSIINKSYNKSIKTTWCSKKEKAVKDRKKSDEDIINDEIIDRFSVEERLVYDSIKPTIVQDMLAIWREHIDPNEQGEPLKYKYLYTVYMEKFDRSLRRWKEYVIGLKNSKWIMKFRETCSYFMMWSLKYKVINRIFAGGFGVTLGEVLGVKPKVASEEDHIGDLEKDEECLDVRKEALRKYGSSVYFCWFSRLRFEKKAGSEGVVVNAPSQFVLDWVMNNYFTDKRFTRGIYV